MAGFLKGWLRGEELKKCSELANACGALAVSRHGCAPSYPSVEELNYFIEKFSKYNLEISGVMIEEGEL